MNHLLNFPFIIVENVIDNDDLTCIVEEFLNLEFISPKHNPNLRTYDMNGNFKYREKIDLLDLKLCSMIKNFFNLDVTIFGSGVLKYTKGQNIGVHADWDNEYNSTLGNKFSISSIFYFNEDFIGGELIFCKNMKENDSDIFILKPQKNIVIFFDSSKFHYTNPILSGTKYSYTNFYSLVETQA